MTATNGSTVGAANNMISQMLIFVCRCKWQSRLMATGTQMPRIVKVPPEKRHAYWVPAPQPTVYVPTATPLSLMAAADHAVTFGPEMIVKSPWSQIAGYPLRIRTCAALLMPAATEYDAVPPITSKLSDSHRNARFE